MEDRAMCFLNTIVLFNKVHGSNPRPGADVCSHCSNSLSCRNTEFHRATWTTAHQTWVSFSFFWSSGMGQCRGEAPKLLSGWSWACLTPQDPNSCFPHPSESLQPARVWPKPLQRNHDETFSAFKHCHVFFEQNMNFSPENRTFCCNQPLFPPVLWFPLSVLPPCWECRRLCPWKVFGTWGGENGSSYKRFC